MIRVAANEVFRRVGLVKLLAQDHVGKWTFIGLQAVVEQSADHCVRVEHEVFAEQSAGVAQSVWIGVGS